jgi:hypothetical protein
LNPTAAKKISRLTPFNGRQPRSHPALGLASAQTRHQRACPLESAFVTGKVKSPA